MRTLDEFISFGKYFWVDPDSYSAEAIKRHFQNSETRERLEKLLPALAALDQFRTDGIEKVVRQVAEQLELQAAELIHPLRVAFTGFHVSPSLFDMMAVLGQETCLRRVQNAIAYLKI